MAKKSKAKLLKELKTLSASADWRLREIEKLSRQEEFKGIKQWAYAHAARSARTWGSKGKNPRFDIKPPTEIKDIEAKIADVKEFLSMKTSLKSSIRSFYKERAQESAASIGLDPDKDWQMMAAYYELEINKKMDDYGYRSVLSALAKIRQQKDKYQKAIEGHRKVVIRGDDTLEQQIIDRMIKEHGRDLRKIGILK